MELKVNKELEIAAEFVRYTNKNVFLTGKAGTGKTTFLHNLRNDSPKRMIVVAPTGVAAINAKGVTIHSFFQLPFGPNLTQEYTGHINSNASRFSGDKINLIKTLDLLVIDEISMVRADLLDGIDEVLRKYKDKSKPFGGVQLLLIGDLHQLAPVIKDDEWEILRPYYETVFFFSSKALQRANYISVELKHIYRQNDALFISLLNKVRENKFDDQTLETLNQRYVPGIEQQDKEGFIILSTHNHQAQTINNQKMTLLNTPEKVFQAELKGDFPAYSYPTDQSLILKEGAQVMFVKNDSSRDKLFFNGKIGTIVGFADNAVLVKCTSDLITIKAVAEEWDNVKYELDPITKEIKENIIGSFRQVPLKLAWCITIHKSQGLTFENAIIDAQSAFAFGQVYVALSRCKTFEGMFLSSPLTRAGIKTDNNVSTFTEHIEQNPPTNNQLNDSVLEYQLALVLDLFSFPFLKYKIGTILLQFFENSTILRGDLYSQYSKMNDLVKLEILEVSDKFQTQIKQLTLNQSNIETNEIIQERIKKASEYFYSKIDILLLELLKNTEIESDNKTIKKAIVDHLDQLYHDLKIKNSCIQACKDGFKVKEYLNARAVSTLQVSQRHAQQASNGKDDKGLSGLYGLIRDWRDNMAVELNVEGYFILPQKVITEIVNILPCSLRELKGITGLGSKKIKSFGGAIVQIVVDFCIQNNLKNVNPTMVQQDFSNQTKTSEQANSSKLTSLQLFKEGKTFTEIASERGFAVSTIEEHLIGFLKTGEVKINDLICETDFEPIALYFKSTEDLSLKTARIELDEKYSYSQLKFVKKHLENTDQIKIVEKKELF